MSVLCKILSKELEAVFSQGRLQIDRNEYPIYVHRDGKEGELYHHHCEKTWIILHHFLERQENVVRGLLQKLEQTYNVSMSYGNFLQIVKDMVFFHDLGKVNPKFQLEKMQNEHVSVIKKDLSDLSTQHSYFGAFFFTTQLLTVYDVEHPVILFLFPYIIWAHHTRLKNPFQHPLLGKKGNKFETLKPTLEILIQLLQIDMQKVEETWKAWGKGGQYDDFKKQLENTDDEPTISIFYNLLYSMFVRADSLASSYAEDDTQVVEKALSSMEERIDEQIREGMIVGFNAKQQEYEEKRKKKTGEKRRIDEERQNMFEEALENLTEPLHQGKRVFYLKMPTGGGKTNTSMGLSLEILKEKANIDRIIYALPYISILEQNYNRLRETLNVEEPREIRKIYSGTETIFDEDTAKIITDDDFFNYPVICTTNVALFNSIVKFDKKHKYKFSSLANSVVILDEIQTLPLQYWPEFNFLINELAEHLNMYFIIMSATVPKLKKLKNLRGQEPQYERDTIPLIKDPEEYYAAFHRNRILTDELQNFDVSKEEGKAKLKSFIQRICRSNFESNRDHGLLVLNTIKSSRIVYSLMKRLNEENDWGTKIRLLNSTFLPLYKREIEGEIKELEDDERYILVSTQTIEAGMDVSFDFVVRDFAILDSIEQVRGRCNREMEKDIGNVYLQKVRKGPLYDHKMIYSNWRIEKTEGILSEDFHYDFSTIEAYYKRLVNYINEELMEDEIALTSADNIRNFCTLNYELNNSPKNRARNVFHADVIEEHRKTYSFFVEITPPTDQFTNQEIQFLKAQEKQTDLTLLSQEKILGHNLITFYGRQWKKLEEFEARKIFSKEMLSILSDFTFSTTINVDRGYGDTEELLDTLFEDSKVGPFYVIDRERIGDEADDWYSLTQGFHHEFERTGKHSNII